MISKDKIELLRNKRVAIVGGSGFIGHNLAIKLASLGTKPYVIDSLQVNNIGYYTSWYITNPNSER